MGNPTENSMKENTVDSQLLVPMPTSSQPSQHNKQPPQQNRQNTTDFMRTVGFYSGSKASKLLVPSLSNLALKNGFRY